MSYPPPLSSGAFGFFEVFSAALPKGSFASSKAPPGGSRGYFARRTKRLRVCLSRYLCVGNQTPTVKHLRVPVPPSAPCLPAGGLGSPFGHSSWYGYGMGNVPQAVATSCDPPAHSHRPRGGSRSCATVRTPRAGPEWRRVPSRRGLRVPGRSSTGCAGSEGCGDSAGRAGVAWGQRAPDRTCRNHGT